MSTVIAALEPGGRSSQAARLSIVSSPRSSRACCLTPALIFSGDLVAFGVAVVVARPSSMDTIGFGLCLAMVMFVKQQAYRARMNLVATTRSRPG